MVCFQSVGRKGGREQGGEEEGGRGAAPMVYLGAKVQCGAVKVWVCSLRVSVCWAPHLGAAPPWCTWVPK